MFKLISLNKLFWQLTISK
uniref:Uncharacterized protein n=1 Tax=Wuchereria bancrofti TaxID=6293 RepID=A0AAF5Q3U7_WUCBA